MNAELNQFLLPEVPNQYLKIQRQTISYVPEFLLFPQSFSTFINIFNLSYKSEEIDILIILLHLYLTHKEKDGLLYINTDDILALRSIKKNRAGYKKQARERIDKQIKNLEKAGFYALCDYKKFNYVLDFNKNFFNNVEKTILVNQKLLSLNPNTKSWHKTIGLYLTFLKNNLSSSSSTIQVKKLLKIISHTSSIKSLFPFQIRQKFEDALDELNTANIFKGWHYKNIDEEALNSKNWFYFWQLLSIKIIF